MPISPADSAFGVVVIGAGPAGLAAARAAAARGARVALVDAAPRPGGQYWRHREGDDGGHHRGWHRFRQLHAATQRGNLVCLFGSSVWHTEPFASGGFSVHATAEVGERTLQAEALVLAPGAYDRQLPFPGWTLPGVFAAGGVQALLKGQGVLAGSRIVVSGTGPFLLAVAAGLAEAGADVAGVFETGGPPAVFGRHPLVLARNLGKVGEAARYAGVLARHRIPYRTSTAVIAAHGGDSVTGVDVAKVDHQWNVLPGTARRIDCDTLAVGYGFTPQLDLPVQLGCATRLDGDGSLVAVVDADQLSSVPGVYIAGEATGVGGAALAMLEGELAGRNAAAAVVGGAADALALTRLRRGRRSQQLFADVLHRAYPVRPGWMGWSDGATLLCRCEEVTVGAVTEAIVDLGAADPRAVKLYARPGMGLCQGRVCGYPTAALVAAHAGRPPGAADLQGMAGRPIASPVTLGALAAAHHRGHRRSADLPETAEGVEDA